MWPLMGGMERGEQSLLCLLLFQNLNNFWFLAKWCFVSKMQTRGKQEEGSWGRWKEGGLSFSLHALILCEHAAPRSQNDKTQGHTGSLAGLG